VARLREKHLPHRVDLQFPGGETAEGTTVGELREDRPAYVEQKTRLVVDRRAESPNLGAEVTATTFVVLLPVDDVPPGTVVTVWKGTPRERTAEVIDAAFFDYNGTPGHVELYLT
jgi:hypothetical protein